jgi:hypothetical protein
MESNIFIDDDAENIIELSGSNEDSYIGAVKTEYMSRGFFEEKYIKTGILDIENIRIGFINFLEDYNVYIPHGNSNKSDMSKWIDPVPHFRKFMTLVRTKDRIVFNEKQIYHLLSNCSMYNSDIRNDKIRLSKTHVMEIPLLLKLNKFLPKNCYREILGKHLASVENDGGIVARTASFGNECFCDPRHLEYDMGKTLCTKLVKCQCSKYEIISTRHFLEYNINAADEYALIRYPANRMNYFEKINKHYEDNFRGEALTLDKLRLLETLRIHIIYILKYCYCVNTEVEITLTHIMNEMSSQFNRVSFPEIKDPVLILKLIRLSLGFVSEATTEIVIKKEAIDFNDPFMLRMENLEMLPTSDVCYFEYTHSNDFKYFSRFTFGKASKKKPVVGQKITENHHETITSGRSMSSYITSPKLLLECIQKEGKFYFDGYGILEKYFHLKRIDSDRYLSDIAGIYRRKKDKLDDFSVEKLCAYMEKDPRTIEEQRLRLIVGLRFLIPKDGQMDLDVYLRYHDMMFNDKITSGFDHNEIIFLINISSCFECKLLFTKGFIGRSHDDVRDIFSIDEYEDVINDMSRIVGYIHLNLSIPSSYQEYVFNIEPEINKVTIKELIAVDKYIEQSKIKKDYLMIPMSNMPPLPEETPSPISLTSSYSSIGKVKVKEDEVSQKEETESVLSGSVSSIQTSSTASLTALLNNEEILNTILKTVKTLEIHLCTKYRIMDRKVQIPVTDMRNELISVNILTEYTHTKQYSLISKAMENTGSVEKKNVRYPKSVSSYLIPVPFSF